MIKNIYRITLLFFALILLGSWGDQGHAMISFRVNLSFNNEMSSFNDWVFYLSEHASDADERKKDDPGEGPKHYIDIDNYPGFLEQGVIPHDLDDCISKYGARFVEENGFLPWATLAMYDSVVNCMRREDWVGAKKYAADLGHYVADGHMPMHLTRNYDGQFTGNNGIHGRYEIDMIARYLDKIVYEGTPAAIVSDPSTYIFNYIYANYPYVDTILLADDYATEMGNGNSSDQYYMALWERTEYLTIEMFRKASNAFADLLYSAWVEAGRPGTEVTQHPAAPREKTAAGLLIYPNPVTAQARISYYNENHVCIKGTVFDTSGRAAMQLSGLYPSAGHHTVEMDPSELSSGNYYLVLQSGNRYFCAPFRVLH